MSKTLATVRAAGSTGLRWLLAALVVLTTIAVIVPFSPRMPGAGLDRSWTFAMNQATAQGLAIGREVIFTFGPYASIYTGTYHPATDAMMLWGSLLFAAGFGIAAVLAFRNGRWPLQLGLIAVLHVVMYVRDPFFFYYPVLVAVCAAREAPSSAADDTTDARRMALLVFLLLPFGLLPLVKGTAWVLCAVVTAIVVLLFAAQRQWKLAALVAATPPVSAVMFWLLAGQPLAGLPGYFVSMIPIVSGYTEAMSIQGSTWQVVAYVVVAAFLLSAMIGKDARQLRTKIALVATFAAALFLGFKGGFVRHDEHAMVAATFLLLMGLLVAAMYPLSQANIALLVCFCVWWSIDAAYTKTSTASLVSMVRSNYKAAWDGARVRVADKARLPREFDQAVAKLRTEAGFPTLSGSSDIYSYDQSYLIASGNRWNPRPVIQSYSAYTPSLLETNKAHLLGSHAPDNLIFNVQPIDDRLPSLEDGASWPVILRNYQPTAFKNDFLFLQRRAEPTPDVTRQPVATGQHAVGETIRLPDSAAPLFVRIDLKPTALGALAGLLYKPTPLRITLTFETGGTRTYRIVSGMARAGFLISPLIENTPELALLYAGPEYIRHKRVRSFSVAPAGGNSLWQSRFDVAFTPVAFPSSPEAVRLLDLDRPTQLAATQKVERAEHCDGSIDILNGQTPPPASFESTRLLGLGGWLAISTEQGQVPDRLLVVATQAGGPTYVIPTRKHPRPDVAAHFRKPQLEASGYAATIDVSQLRGQFTLGLGYEADGKINLCPQFAIPGRFGGS